MRAKWGIPAPIKYNDGQNIDFPHFAFLMTDYKVSLFFFCPFGFK